MNRADVWSRVDPIGPAVQRTKAAARVEPDGASDTADISISDPQDAVGVDPQGVGLCHVELHRNRLVGGVRVKRDGASPPQGMSGEARRR